MPKHRQFEELCALSASGELSREEAVVLRDHMEDCSECRNFLADTRDVAGNLVPTTVKEVKEVKEVELPAGMRERFLSRAASEGLHIVVGPPVHTPAPAEREGMIPVGRVERVSTFALLARSWQAWVLMLGACTACLLAGLAVRTPLANKWPSLFGKTTASVATPPSNLKPETSLKHETWDLKPGTDATSHSQLVALTAERDKRAAQITSLTQQLDDLKKQRQDSETSLTQKLASTESTAVHDHEALTRQSEVASARVTELESQLNALRQQQSVLEADLHTERARATEYSARLELAQKAIHTDAAFPTPPLVTSALTPAPPVDSAVGSLVAARNLHIIDVYDSNAAGTRQRAFGRVFYVEGRSLVFYAFDLAAPHQSKNITFHLWGERAGQKETTLSLGILHDDDPAERRWALTFDDPKVLAKINSVYVTAESKPGDQPRGPKVLYAYFGSQPNHP